MSYFFTKKAEVKVGLTLILFLFLYRGSIAQPISTATASVVQMATALQGSGVTISNLTLTQGNPAQMGTFSNGTGIGIGTGAVLSSGNVATLMGNAGSFSSSSYGTTGGVPNVGGANDAVVVDFDIVPATNALNFNFVFGSEEYQFSGNNPGPNYFYNDGCVVYITGPGIVGMPDIAPVQGTNQMVRMTTLNNAANSAYYIWNPACNIFAFAGYSTTMSCSTVVVQPCQTYHIKMATFDAGDWGYDAAMFLSPISSGNLSVTATNSTVISGPACPGSAVTLTANSPIPGGIYTWNPGGIVGQSVVVYPNTTTTYTVTYSITNGNCSAQDTATTTVVISNTLTANITPVNPSVCAGSSVTLTCAGVGINQYQWTSNNPPAPNPNNTATVTVTPAQTTIYTVVASNATCTDTVSDTVTVIPIPNSPFSVSPSPVCAGQPATITYTGSGSAAATYVWGFGGGSPSSGNGQGPLNVTWNTPGNYVDSLTVTENGCTSPLTTVAITVNAVPTSSFSYTPVICQGSSSVYSYTGTAGGAAGYTWIFGGGNPGSANGQGPQNVTYANSGSYNSSLTVTENGCTSPVTMQVIHVTPMPTNTFTLASQICFGDSALVTYTGNGNTASATFNWSWGANPNVTMTQPGAAANTEMFHFSQPGNYTITLLVSDSGCSMAAGVSQNISVIQTPSNSFSWQPAIGCPNVPVQFMYTGTVQSGSVYSWIFSGGAPAVSNSQNPGVSFGGAGDHTVSLQVTDAICASPVNSQVIHIDTLPVVTATFSPDHGCDQITVDFINTSTNVASSYWRFGDGSDTTLASNNGVNHTYTNGTYNVELIITTPYGCVDSAGLLPAINVIPTPTAGFSASPDINVITQLQDATYQFTNTSINATQYIWMFGDGDSTSAFSPSHQYEDTGHYTVTLVAINQYGCMNTISVGPYIVIPNNNYFIPSAFTPNHDGENDEFKLYGANITDIYYTIFDRWGNKMFETRDMSIGWDGMFHGKEAQTGVYMYYAELTFLDGEKVHLKGDITLVK